MFNMKKAIAFLLALIMVFSCMPVSLAEGKDDKNQVMDTFQNKEVVLVENEGESEEPEKAESLELSSEDLSVTQLSEKRLEELKGLLPVSEEKDGEASGQKGGSAGPRRGAKLLRASQPVTRTSTGFAAFEISPVNLENEAEQYVVNVSLGNPIDLLDDEDAIINSVAFELYHIHTDEKDNTEVDKYTEETGLDVECENDQITGFSFSTPDFSEFVLKYTVVFHFEDKTFEQREIPGAKDIPLAEILTGLEIVSAEDAEAFMAELAVEVSDYGVIQLGFDDRGSWTFRVLKETEEPASLILTKQNGQKYIISVSATGNTELATEDNSAVIHTVNDYYLPEEAEIYAASLTDEKDDAAIAAVQNLTGGKKEEDEEEKTGYQAFSIGLNAVNTNEYEGFDVEVRLTEELSGRDFRLYEVKNGEAKEIKDIQLTANTRSDGSQDVQGFSFTTNGFADYVLCYSLVTYYTTASGETYEITLNYGKEAGIPGGAELKVSELQKDSEEYNEHLEEAAEKLGVSSEDLTFARFFDIEIWAENKQIQPKAPVEVTIALADMPETENAVIDVVHFGKDGVAVVEAETEEGICFDADSFSVYGIIAVSSLPQGVEGLDGYSVKISNQGYYVGSGVITDVTPSRISKTNSEKDAAVWSFEAAGTSGDYYLATMVNTGTEENKNYVKKYLTFSHYDVDRWENHRAHAFLSDTPQQAFTVSKNGNDYRIGTSIDGIPYYLNQFDGTDGVGFAGYEYADASQAQLSIKFTQPVYQTGHNYAVIIEHNNAYYAVMNDGSLQEVVYNATNNTVEMEYPIFWTYSSEEVTREITNGAYAGPVTNLRIKAEATGYDANQLASGVYYRYFAPETDSGIIEEPKISDNPTNEEVSEQHLRYVWNNAIRYENNHIKGLNKYIGVDENALKICGNIESADQAAVVYLAEVINVLPGGTGTANNETVNHIDIAIVGTGFLDVPLAYGTYYDAYKNQVVTVTSETPVTLHLKKDVDIDKYDIMRASVHAYDKNGNELNDAFYITGYTSNARTDHSAVQVRMEGSFKVDTLDPYVGGNSNLDEDRMAERKQNQVYYTVSTIKNVEFELEYPDPNNPNQTIKLYDEKGNPLKVKAKVRMSAGFSYWDENNECPPLQDDFEEKYSWLYNDLEERNIHIEKGYNNSYWEKGAIIDNTWGYPYFRGESGMDFVLGSKDDADGKTVAIEIVKIIEDENGSYLHPSTDIRSDFSVYYNSDKSAQEKVYGLGNPGSIDSNNAGLANSHSGYNPLRNEYILVGEDGIGVLYDYNVSEGMFYIEEDSSSMAAGGANAVITDIEGLKWAYVRTSTETEYVWRNDGKSGRHIVNGYSSVPEILGDYTDVAGSDVGTDGKKLRNGFLEFYVRNIYKLKTSNLQISKTIVSPVPTDSTNKEFTFTVKVTKPNKDKTPLTGEFVGETYDKNGVKIETKNYIFNENGETTVTTTGNQTVKLVVTADDGQWDAYIDYLKW